MFAVAGLSSIIGELVRLWHYSRRVRLAIPCLLAMGYYSLDLLLRVVCISSLVLEANLSGSGFIVAVCGLLLRVCLLWDFAFGCVLRGHAKGRTLLWRDSDRVLTALKVTCWLAVVLHALAMRSLILCSMIDVRICTQTSEK